MWSCRVLLLFLALLVLPLLLLITTLLILMGPTGADSGSTLPAGSAICVCWVLAVLPLVLLALLGPAVVGAGLVSNSSVWSSCSYWILLSLLDPVTIALAPVGICYCCYLFILSLLLRLGIPALAGSCCCWSLSFCCTCYVCCSCCTLVLVIMFDPFFVHMSPLAFAALLVLLLLILLFLVLSVPV